MSSCTVFEKLYDITHNIVFSACIFESRAEVYHANKFGDQEHLCDLEIHQNREWSPNPLRIEEKWFMWVPVSMNDEFGVLHSTNLHAEYLKCSKRRDIENLCRTLWMKLCELLNKWVMHSCKVKGCEGYVTVDGNEKLVSYLCSSTLLCQVP